MFLHKAAQVTYVALLVSIIGLSPAAMAESAGSNAGAGKFIQTLANEAIQVLSTTKGSLQEREDKFRTLLRDDFAMEKIGRFVVGGYWRQMTPEQKKKYQKLFSEWVLRTYSVRLGGYSGEHFQVVRTSNVGARDVIVHTRIEKSAGDGFNANWRVRKVDGHYKIIDIYVEGVSMAVTQRSEFESVLRRNGIDGLISTLQSRLNNLSSAS